MPPESVCRPALEPRRWFGLSPELPAETVRQGRLAGLGVRFLRSPQAALIGCAALLAVQIGPWWYSSIDSASYLSMGRSLASGAGPLNFGSRLWWYSPGYPALISPLFLLDQRPFLWISVFQWLLAMGLLLGVYRWCQRFAPDGALWIVSLTAVNHGLWLHYRRPLSEIAFLCVLVWTAVVIKGLCWQGERRAFAWRLSCSAALVALLCVIRPVGIMLAPAIAAWIFCSRPPWRRAVVASLVLGAAAALPVALFVLHERLTAAELGGRTYVDEFHEAAQTPLASWAAGVQMCISDIGRVCIPGLFKSHGTPGDWTDPNMLIHVPFLALICYGWRRWTVEQQDPLAWYMPFYFILIAAHAIDTGARLMLPLLPALLVCIWFALRAAASWRRIVFAACLVLQLLAGGGYWLIHDLPQARELHRHWAEIDEVVALLRADPGASVESELPSELHLMLQLALDRPVPQRQPSGSARADWIVELRPCKTAGGPASASPVARCCLRRSTQEAPSLSTTFH
jgi:hypothetical protein